MGHVFTRVKLFSNLKLKDKCLVHEWMHLRALLTGPPAGGASFSLDQSERRRAAPLALAPAVSRRWTERVEDWRRSVSVREPRSPRKDAQNRAAGLPKPRSVLRSTLRSTSPL